MHQVLFRLPIIDWPIYGYGMMLFLAYFFCTWLASRLAKKEGIPGNSVYDMSLWIFVCGILGGRITFMIQFRDKVPFTLESFLALWEGGLIFYGAAAGGVVGYLCAYRFVLRKHNLSTWKWADIIAPCAALGLLLGRIGCLLNGCCYGNVACVDCPAVHFPFPTDPRFKMVRMGYQTAAGFTLAEDNEGQVAKVEPNSPAARAGLRDLDVILEVESNGEMKKVNPYTFLGSSLDWPRGQNDLTFKVARNGNKEFAVVGPFVPLTIGLHPTQVYESISMGLTCLLLLAYYPYRRRAGSLMVIFMLVYAVHRFINEMLRVDTDPVAIGMTLSQNISIAVFAGGLFLAFWLWLGGSRINTGIPTPADPRLAGG